MANDPNDPTKGYSDFFKQQHTDLPLEAFAPRTPLTREQMIVNRDEADRGYARTNDPEERKAYKALAARWQRDIDRLDAPEQSNEDAEADDEADLPTQEQMYAYFAQHPIQVQSGRSYRVIDPHTFTPEVLAETYRLETESDTLAGDDATETVDGYTAGPGPTPEDIAWLKRIAQQREQLRVEREADRVKRKAERQAQREADRARDKADREQAAAVREQKAEKRREKAKQEREQAAQAAAQAKATAKANAAAAASQAKLAAEQRKDAEEQARLAAIRQQQQAERAAKQRKLYLDTVGRAAGAANNASVTLGNWPRPGGIGLLLITILFVLFAIVPMNANGDTRLMLMWLAIRGKVTLPTSGSTSLKGGEGSGSASGSGGGSGSSPVVPPIHIPPVVLSNPLNAAASSSETSAADGFTALSSIPAASGGY